MKIPSSPHPPAVSLLGSFHVIAVLRREPQEGSSRSRADSQIFLFLPFYCSIALELTLTHTIIIATSLGPCGDHQKVSQNEGVMPLLESRVPGRPVHWLGCVLLHVTGISLSKVSVIAHVLAKPRV